MRLFNEPPAGDTIITANCGYVDPDTGLPCTWTWIGASARIRAQLHADRYGHPVQVVSSTPMTVDLGAERE